MFLELHILQNFAPSNLNRDDTGSPKDCEFGGYRRARISSQCLKRAIRMEFPNGLMTKDNLALRSNRVRTLVVDMLVAKGRPEAEATNAATAAFGALGILVSEDSKSQYLVFAGQAELRQLAAACDEEWGALQAGYAKAWEPKIKVNKVVSKDDAQKAVNKTVKDKLVGCLNGGKAPDLALFGRMLADLPDKNIDAASQVAHAISTNRVSMEFDFYTAVDDIQGPAETGAGMMGTVEFNSACFYRYANVDLGQLLCNLGKDEDLTRRTTEAFLRASVAAIPTGKQSGTAAQNPPSFVFAVVRERGLWSLANAFLKPVQPGKDGDLVQESVRTLARHWRGLTQMYGNKGIVGAAFCAMEDVQAKELAPETREKSIDALVERVMGAVQFKSTVKA